MLFSVCRLAEFFDVLFLYCNWQLFWHKHNQFPQHRTYRNQVLHTILSKYLWQVSIDIYIRIYGWTQSGSSAHHGQQHNVFWLYSSTWNCTIMSSNCQFSKLHLATLGSLHYYQCWEQDDKCFRKSSWDFHTEFTKQFAKRILTFKLLIQEHGMLLHLLSSFKSLLAILSF